MGTTPARPLRWPKFLAVVALSAAALAAALPALRLYASVIRGPWVEAPVLPSPGWIALGALALLCIGWSIADAAFDRRLPRPLLAGLVLSLGALGPLQALTPAERRAPRPDGRTELAKLLGTARRHAQQALDRDGAIPADGWASVAATARSSWRGRDLRLIQPSVRVFPGAEGPVLSPPDGAPPGSVLLAIRRDGAVAWLTGVTFEDGRLVLLRQGTSPLVLGVARGLGSTEEGSWSATRGAR